MHVRFLQKQDKYGQKRSYQLLMEELYFGVNTKSKHRARAETEKMAGNEKVVIIAFCQD